MENRESMTSNTAIHLSRIPKAVFFFEYTLRPGDGERWANVFDRQALGRALAGKDQVLQSMPRAIHCLANVSIVVTRRHGQPA